MHRARLTLLLVSSALLVSTITAEEEAGPGAPDEGPAAAEEVDLQESEDEAIGDRIMEEMNGMKVCLFQFKNVFSDVQNIF